ncbi:uncharacterized protein LOC113517381 [Galleria mellonella]|uniref:Uncharacterized protein LOC113517381 n=1 Tax=Galleria mellonella TaxID=7137 RepID=A0A6J3C752_GALME|nr:uncharacterized protein LOC113517381 [Galleria mellonella]
MAGYLWGIGQLVNDPSSQIINAIQQHILRKQEEKVCSTSSDQTKPQLEVVVNSDELFDIKTNNNNIATVTCNKKLSEYRSECTQIGNGSTKHRNVAVQCKKSFCNKTSRTTSIQQVNYIDNSTTTPSPGINRKNAQTNTFNNRICDEHQKVFTLLRDWSTIERLNVKVKLTLIERLKLNIQGILKLIQLNKIENIPRYHPCQKNVLRLYKSISLNDIKLDNNICMIKA